MNTSAKLLAPTRSRRAASAAFVSALLFALTLAADAKRARAQDANAAPQPAQSTAPTIDANAAVKATRGNAGTITGRVLGEGGEPLAGARVIVRAASANRSNFEPLAVADEAGNFRLDDLAPGLYQVGASVRGLVPDPEAYPPGRPTPLYRPGDSVTVRLVRGGVLTGTVTGGDGEPLVAISVRAVYVRDLEGDPASAGYTFGTDQTDDRGVYRIYGLRQGVYAVAAGPEDAVVRGPGSVTAYANEAPTYYPSGTRDTAAEVTVRNGQETAGIDIRHRGERGRRVTGVVTWGPGAGNERGAFVTLTHAATGMQVGTAFTPPNAGATGANERPFAFDAVAEGEYEVQARSSDAGLLLSTSPPQRVVVGAADATGLRLTLAPLASISGSLIIQPSGEAERAKGECKDRHTSLLPQESLVAAHQEDLPKRGAAARRDTVRRETAPASSGEFTLRSLEPGRYRLDLRLADDNWYVREVQLPAPTPPATTRPGAAGRTARPAAANSTAAAASATGTRETVELKSGQQLAGVFVRLAEGAASLAGRVAPREENAPLPPAARLRVHLVPADREQAEDTLRYHETSPAPDGTFAFKNLAPGRYLLLAREADAEERARPAAWDAATRTRLRREAEAADTSVELAPCRHVNDFALRFPQAPVR